MFLSQHPWAAILALFIAALVSSAVWTAWHRAVADARPVAAATLDTLIVLLSTLTVLEYTHAPLALLGSYAGTFVGTYLSVRISAGRRPPLHGDHPGG